MEKGAPINCTKFTGKHLCQSLLFNKLAGLRTATLLKKKPWHVFSCEFCAISKNILFTEHLWATASDFICGLVFIVSIIKIIASCEKGRLVENRLKAAKRLK